MKTTKPSPNGCRSFQSVTQSSPTFARLILTLGALLFAIAPQARASSDVWDGSTSGVWAASANWLTDPAVVPGAGDTATFNGPGNGFTFVDLGTGVTLSNLVFDTASAAAYTIGTGAAGSQALALDNGGGISLGAGVGNNQLINALLNLPGDTNAVTTIGNVSSQALTLAGGISAIPTNGNSLLSVTNVGDVNLTGELTETGAGNLALLKAGPGKLTISSNAVWSGNAALGRIPATSGGFPLVAREGTLLLNGGLRQW